MTRYRQAYEQMVKDNPELFAKFKEAHDGFLEDEAKWQDKFNELGRDVMNAVRKYEDILCKRSEIHGYGNYTSKLAEKFQEEVRRNFPKIDHVGVKRTIMKPVETPNRPTFIRKINF